MSVTDPGAIVRLIVSNPVVLSNEKAVQEEISRLLDREGIRHKREVVLSEGNVVEFMVEGGVAMEIKLKAPKRAVYRQCERYCEHAQVKALVLVTATAMGFPGEIKGKPCWMASLGTGWL